jgi:5-methylcytosine-specific restriction protein A
MPTSPAAACLEPRCPGRAVYRSRCEAHRHLVTSEARGYGPEWRRLSLAVRARAGNRCERCGQAPTEPYAMTVDHIRPRSLGGTDHPSNLRVLCRSCHQTIGLQSRARARG